MYFGGQGIHIWNYFPSQCHTSMLNPRWLPKWMLDYRTGYISVNIQPRNMIPDSIHMFLSSWNANLQLHFSPRSHMDGNTKMASNMEA